MNIPRPTLWSWVKLRVLRLPYAIQGDTTFYRRSAVGYFTEAEKPYTWREYIGAEADYSLTGPGFADCRPASLRQPRNT